ncbi:MAG TPA: hypothetical protein VGP32_08145 [Steroidobacteraceae bacterium]|jgi:hypothetical protein|nr:hypothetical protein [Steroidobacteraceae bacterium]
MRVVACCLLILGALAGSDSGPARVEAARCAPAAGSNGAPAKSKPSSFAPHRGHGHVYGVPIQPAIFRAPIHHKPQKPTPSPQ